MTDGTATPQERLRKERCLVLGGSGFIGLNLCLSLRDVAASVRAFSRTPVQIDGVEWFGGNFLDIDRLVQALAGIDVVFHLVGSTTPASSNSQIAGDADANIVATIRLLETCARAGVKRLVFASSGGTVYGECREFPTTESHPTDPISAYGVSKLAIEKYVALFERLYGMTGLNMRISNPYGPYQTGRHKQGIIGTVIKKVMAGEAVEIWGDGSIIRDYLYIDDLVGAFQAIAGYQGSARVLNIGSGTGVSVREIIRIVGAGVGVEPQVNFFPARSVDISRVVLDCGLANAQLGWVASTALEVGVGKTIVWFRDMANTES